MGDGDGRMFSISYVFYLPGSNLWFCCFSIENKKKKYWEFFSWMCVPLRSRLLFIVRWLFLTRPGISLTYMTLIFPHGSTCRLYTGCFCHTWGDFSSHPLKIANLLLNHHHIQQGSLVQKGPSIPLSVSSLPSSLPGTWRDRKLPSKPASAHAGYLRKSSTQVLRPVI